MQATKIHQKSFLNRWQRAHLFNYAKNHDPAWVDPNEELTQR